MDAIINAFSQHGLVGLIIAFLFITLWLFIRELKSLHLLQINERKDWMKTVERNTNAIIMLQSKI